METHNTPKDITATDAARELTEWLRETPFMMFFGQNTDLTVFQTTIEKAFIKLTNRKHNPAALGDLVNAFKAFTWWYSEEFIITILEGGVDGVCELWGRYQGAYPTEDEFITQKLQGYNPTDSRVKRIKHWHLFAGCQECVHVFKKYVPPQPLVNNQWVEFINIDLNEKGE